MCMSVAGEVVSGQRGGRAASARAGHMIGGEAHPGAHAPDAGGGILGRQRSRSANVASGAARSLTGGCAVKLLACS